METFGGYSLLNGSLESTFSGWDTNTTVFLKRWFGVTSDFSGQYWSASSTNPRIPGEITSSTLKFREVPTSFLIGPHFTYRHSRYAPFAQALFGVTHDRFKVSVVDPAQCGPAFQAPCSEYAGQVLTNVSYTKFAMALGGGIDIAVGHGISIRPVQAEYFLRHLPAILGPGNSPPPEFFHVNEFRYSAGISFRFGPHLGQSR